MKSICITMLISLFWTVSSFAAPTISVISDQTIDEDTNLTVTFTVGSDGSTGGNGGTSPFPFPFPTTRSAPDRTVRADGTIEVTVTTDNHVLVPDEGIALNRNGSNYTLIISPAAEESGQATIYITADDGSYSAQESFVLTVRAVNDAPTAHAPENQDVNEDEALVFSENNGNRLSVSDVDAEDSPVEVTVGVLHGDLDVSTGNGGVVTGHGTGDVRLTGTLTAINNRLQGLVYRPDSDWNGEDTLTLTITDKPGAGSGPVNPFPFPFPSGDTGTVTTGDSKSDAETLKITVQPVPDPLTLALPVETIEIAEDASLSFDPDSEPSIDVVDADGPFGQFEVGFRSDGPVAFFVPEHAEVIVEYNGPDDLLLRGTLPQINAALSGVSDENGPLPGLMIEPEADWNGELNLSVTATDLTSFDTATGEMTILVNPVNDAPTLEEGVLYALENVAMNDTDPSGNKVVDITENLASDTDNPDHPAGIAVINADSANGVWEYSVDNGVMWDSFGEDLLQENALLLSPTHMIRFVPAADWSGTAEMTFRAWDETGNTQDTTENGDATPFSSTSGTATVTVSDGPAAPPLAADAGTDLDVLEGDTVFLDGSGSQIPDDLNVTVSWSQTGGQNANLKDSDTLQPSFKASHVSSEGAELEFQLTLTDELGRSRSDRVTIRVSDSDLIRADAGLDQVVREGDVVYLSAANSFIPDDITPIFHWERSSENGPEPGNPNVPETTFIAPDLHGQNSMEIEFLVTISDNDGQSRSDSITVTVLPAGSNLAPIADAGSDQTVRGGDSVILDGSGSSDPDGVIATYQWESVTDNGLFLNDPDSAITALTAPDAGNEAKTLTFRLTVTDDQGLSSSDTIRITVSADVSPPSGPGQGNKISLTAQEGQTVTLEAGNFGAGSDYSWAQTSGNPQVTLSDFGSPSPTFVAPSVNAGGATLDFELIVDAANGNRHIQEYRVVIQNNGIVGFPANVMTFRLFNGSTMGIQVSGSGRLVKLESIDPAEIPGNRKNRPAALPYGLIDMVIKVDEPGDTVNVTVYPESPASPENTWFKYSEADGWENYSDHSHMKPDGTEITVFLADGGPGDVDGIANGLIVDPSGPALPSSSTASGGGDGDDGGCFIQTIAPKFF